MSTGIAVLGSGAGTNFDEIRKHVPVKLFIADRMCPAIKIASDARIPNLIVPGRESGSYFDRLGFTRKVYDALKISGVQVVAMAGFMTILDAFIFGAFKGVILNLHPSLLPRFKGGHAVRDTLAYFNDPNTDPNEKRIAGCTIHIATPELDEGPYLVQCEVPIMLDDTEETLHARIKTEEAKTYSAVIKQLLTGTSWPFVSH